jgi:hypothetical protein
MRLFYEIIDKMNGQIANRFSEIDQLGFLSLLDCRLYGQFASIFPENALDVLLKNYGQCLNMVRFKNELSYVGYIRSLSSATTRIMSCTRNFMPWDSLKLYQKSQN